MDDFRLGSIARCDPRTEQESSGSNRRRKKQPPKETPPGEDQVVVTPENPDPDAAWASDSYTPSAGTRDSGA
jgi:hypothetical protein